jgi:hypothetical protein
MSPANDHHAGSRIRYELVAAITLAVLAIGCFIVQAVSYDAKTTQRETILFNTLQFLLTFGFAWFSTRAVSRGEFEQSLKRFAIGAYRRISDIEAMVVRLEDKIRAMRVARAQDDRADLDVVTAIVEDTRQVVHSSIADWADVIGEELIAISTIKGLEREKSVIQSSPAPIEGPSLEATIEKIDKRIAELSAALPANLAFDAQRDDEATYAKQFAADWMSDQHKEQGGLHLRIVTGGQYTCERDPKQVRSGEPIFVLCKPERVEARDSAGVALGRVLNNSPLTYGEFRDALTHSYGTDHIEGRFDKVFAERDTNGVHYVWYEVVIVSTPVVRPRARRRKSASH